ncbi:MAG: SAF domain-containing protein, partial [Kiloniellales bacterium]|nr:SAF domain-containing protein [Kiloniellales bacterium]
MAASVETAEPRTLRLHAEDNIAVAIDPLAAGLAVAGITTRAPIPRGHKVATREIPEGEAIRKFGQIIGFATGAIAPGEHVHEHNCAMKDFARDYRFAEAARPEDLLPETQRATFQGFRRDSGRVGTRNYVGILTSVNCSASVARFIAQAAEREGLLADYP